MFLWTLFYIEVDVMSPGITSAYYATLLIPSVASLCYIGESGRKRCLQPSAFSIYWIIVGLADMKSQSVTLCWRYLHLIAETITFYIVSSLIVHIDIWTFIKVIDNQDRLKTFDGLEFQPYLTIHLEDTCP